MSTSLHGTCMCVLYVCWSPRKRELAKIQAQRKKFDIEQKERNYIHE